MGTALTDALIDLALPSARAVFSRDPDAFLQGRGLSESEIAALRTKEFGPLWRHAKAHASTDPSLQFNRHDQLTEMLIEVDPVVELHTENNDNIAVGALGQIVIDEEGRRYRVVPLNDLVEA